MRPSTKGQIQIGETIAVIVVFMILLVFALVWYSQSSQASQLIEQDKAYRLELLEMAKVVMNMPEIQCSVASSQDTTCMDYYRLHAVALQNSPDASEEYREEYLSQFLADRRAGYGARVHVIYPDIGIDPVVRLFDYRPVNVLEDNEPSAQVPIPVIVYDPITDMRSFGMLVLEQYIEETRPTEAAS